MTETDKQALLKQVQQTQDAFWKALFQFERAINREIDGSEIDFSDFRTVQEIIEGLDRDEID